MSRGYGHLSSGNDALDDEENSFIIESPFPPVTSRPAHLNYNRRRTEQTFCPVSGLNNLHSNPTVGSSGLTASFSTNNLSGRRTSIPRPIPITKTSSWIPTPTQARHGRVSLGNPTTVHARSGRPSLGSSDVQLEEPKQLRVVPSSMASTRSFSSRIPTPTFNTTRQVIPTPTTANKENMPLTIPRPCQVSRPLPEPPFKTPRPLPEPERNMGPLSPLPSPLYQEDLCIPNLSPSPPAPSITKSRTMNMLSTFTSSLSISSISAHLTSSRSSLSSITNRNKERLPSTRIPSSPHTNPLSSSPLISSPLVSSPLNPSLSHSPISRPLPIFTTNIRQITTAQPHAYWLGRVTALSDRFSDQIHQEAIALPIEDLALLTSPLTPTSTPPTRRSKKALSAKSNSEKEEERRAKRIFVHLEALCLTEEARKSLRGFQIEFARSTKAPHLLPRGVGMQEGEGLLGKMGRVFSSGSGIGSRRGSGFGGAHGRRRESLLCLNTKVNGDSGE